MNYEVYRENTEILKDGYSLPALHFRLSGNYTEPRVWLPQIIEKLPSCGPCHYTTFSIDPIVKWAISCMVWMLDMQLLGNMEIFTVVKFAHIGELIAPIDLIANNAYKRVRCLPGKLARKQALQLRRNLEFLEEKYEKYFVIRYFDQHKPLEIKSRLQGTQRLLSYTRRKVNLYRTKIRKRYRADKDCIKMFTEIKQKINLVKDYIERNTGLIEALSVTHQLTKEQRLSCYCKKNLPNYRRSLAKRTKNAQEESDVLSKMNRLQTALFNLNSKRVKME